MTRDIQALWEALRAARGEPDGLNGREAGTPGAGEGRAQPGGCAGSVMPEGTGGLSGAAAVTLEALRLPRPSLFFRRLLCTGNLSPWFQELEGANDIPAGPFPYHQESVLEHLCEEMDALAGDALAAWMALCHDLGKTRTPAAQWPHHYQHEELGAPMALALASRLGLPEFWARAGNLAARLHMKAGKYAELRPGTRRDLLFAVHEAGLDGPFWKLVDVDRRLRVSGRALSELDFLLRRTAGRMSVFPETSPVALREFQCRELASFPAKEKF